MNDEFQIFGATQSDQQPSYLAVLRDVSIVFGFKMNRLLNIIALILCAVFAAESHAGQERESISYTRGMFLSFDRGGLVAFDSRDKLLELINHCKKSGTVFNHTQKRRYRCKSSPLGDPADFSFIRIEIQGATAPDEGESPHVFTTRQPRVTAWEIRALSEQQKAAINELLRLDPTRYGSLIARLRFKKAVAVKRPNSGVTTFFVPGEQIKDDEAFYAAERHHVFVAREDAYRYQGKLVAAPTQYLDLNGDDFPEVVVGESCDGMCVSIWSIHSGPKSLGNLGGH